VRAQNLLAKWRMVAILPASKVSRRTPHVMFLSQKKNRRVTLWCISPHKRFDLRSKFRKIKYFSFAYYVMDF
jgi:hypothetical protein